MKCLELQTTCAVKRLLWAGLLVPSLALAQPSAVHLNAQATVKGQVVHLGDVARIAGSEASRLSGVELGPAPLPGYSRSLSADYIRIRLKQQKLDPEVIAADSATMCRITAASQKLSRDEILQTALKALQDKVETGEGRISIEPISQPREMTLPVGKLDIVADAMDANPGVSTRRVHVQVMVDGKSFGQMDLMMRVRRYVKIAVAKATIQRGDVLSADRVAYEERDLTGLPDDVIREGESLDGLQAAQIIAPKAPITHTSAAAPAALHRGDAITLRGRAGRIVVSSPGVASEDGRIGQTIRVKNTTSNKETRGVVIDAKTVEVAL
jgi:flagella basal body P-ring formation protein FlgA